MDEPKKATMTVEEAGKLLGVSRNTAYDAVRSGQIPSVRVGKRYLIPLVAMDRLLKVDAKQ